MSALEKASPAGVAQPYSHEHVRGTAGAWGAVSLILLAAIAFGFAVPLYSWALAIIGIVLGICGVALGKIAGLMEQFY